MEVYGKGELCWYIETEKWITVVALFAQTFTDYVQTENTTKTYELLILQPTLCLLLLYNQVFLGCPEVNLCCNKRARVFCICVREVATLVVHQTVQSQK